MPAVRDTASDREISFELAQAICDVLRKSARQHRGRGDTAHAAIVAAMVQRIQDSIV